MVNSPKINLNSIFCSMFIISIVVISLICSEANEDPRGPVVRVTIQNDNDYLLGVHCKSRDDDIGFHILAKGQLIRWKFRQYFHFSTLFFCGFSQGQIKKGVFEVYNAPRDIYRCTQNCTWMAKSDGLYGYADVPKGATLIYKWFK
ncbi:putative S-protein4 [Cardamine amara subsp. amara]|uniref:S-protein homolog n=1 Tax=Cardamine amara subsp. amara TaxID=228776 RepID=A0ABD0ZQI7_CARAN